MELCASPLNCHWRRYCSSYLDVDAPFGSLGDLFKFNPTRGSFEANPPFVPEIMSEMVVHIDALLSKSQQKGPFKSGGIEVTRDYTSIYKVKGANGKAKYSKGSARLRIVPPSLRPQVTLTHHIPLLILPFKHPG